MIFKEQTIETKPGILKKVIILDNYSNEDKELLLKNNNKFRKRLKIQNLTDNYDIFDIVADISNAFRDVIDGKINTNNIEKFRQRHDEIQKIIKG